MHEFGDWMKSGIIAVGVVAAMAGGCSYLNHKAGLQDDNFAEESLEAVIEHHTGWDVDLSPGSSER